MYRQTENLKCTSASTQMARKTCEQQYL